MRTFIRRAYYATVFNVIWCGAWLLWDVWHLTYDIGNVFWLICTGILVVLFPVDVVMLFHWRHKWKGVRGKVRDG